MHLVYLLFNTQTGMGYVGQTSSSMRERWQRHCYDAEKRKLETFLARAIRKYGKESFRFRILEETDTPLEREQFWIKELRTFEYGYNLTLGGEGTKGLKRSNETKKKISEAKKGKLFTNEHKKNLSFARKKKSSWNKGVVGINNPLFGKKRPKKVCEKISQSKQRKVLQVSLEGQIIKIFNSIEDAAKASGCFHSNIVKVCQGKRKKAGGYKWSYFEENNVSSINC